MRIQPYLSFEGRCEEAIEFYKKAIGAQVQMLMRVGESPDPCPPEVIPSGSEQKVLHASLLVGDTIIMMTDGMCAGKAHFSGISLSLSVADDAEAERVFAALGEGGQATMPLDKTFFASKFGMLNDRFGVSWMIVTEQP